MKEFVTLLYTTLIIVNLLLFFLHKQSRIVVFLSLLFLLFIMGGNTVCADYEDYETFYESQTYPLLWEPGYVNVANFFSSMGLSFIEFRLILFSVSIFFNMLALRHITKDAHFFILIYISILFVIDTIQIRNTIAISFLFYGIVLLSHGKKYLFVVSLILSSLFHFSFVVFLPLIFYHNILKFDNKHSKFILITFSILSIISASGSFYFFQDIVSLVNESKLDYLNSNWFNLVYLLLPLLFYYIAKMSRLLLDKSDTYAIINIYSNIVCAMGTLFVIYMPILATSHDFARIIRDAGVELVALIGIVFTYKSKGILYCKGVRWGRYKLTLFLMLIIWLIGIQYWLGYGEIIDNNILY